MRGIKSRAEKFYVPTTLQKTEKKIEWTRAEKKGHIFQQSIY